MLSDYIRQIHAQQNFKIKDNFEFLDFDDITPDTIGNKEPVPEHIELWAAVKINYEGKAPDSYKILNLSIGDWVTSHEKELTRVIHKNLKNYFQKNYPNSETSEVHEESESSIWEDQLDYMPRVDVDKKTMIIEIELVLESEIMED